MKNNYGYTALRWNLMNYNIECAQILWQFPEERNTLGL